MWSPTRKMRSPRSKSKCESKIAFCQLLLKKIIKIACCHQMSDFKAKMHKKNPKFGWGSAPDPAGELTALPRPLAGFKGPTSKVRGGEAKGGEGRRGEGKGREGTRGGDGRGVL